MIRCFLELRLLRSFSHEYPFLPTRSRVCVDARHYVVQVMITNAIVMACVSVCVNYILYNYIIFFYAGDVSFLCTENCEHYFADTFC